MAAFVALTFFPVPFPVVVGVAAFTGWVLGRTIPNVTKPKAAAKDDRPPPLISDDTLHAERPSGRVGLSQAAL